KRNLMQSRYLEDLSLMTT
ncbi:hypothetical protein CP8484711_0512B, partial [Chlamydia psittaci 84-8471/1]